MAETMEKSKVYEPDWFKAPDLPESIDWANVIDAPRSVSELSIQDGIALSNATSAIDGLGDLAYEDLVTELELADEAVTNAKIAVDAIQGDVIAASAITEVKISNNAISAAKIQAAAVVAGKIAANAVTATTIAADAVTATKIQADAVTAGKIAAGAIDGITITGSLVRTSSSGTRAQLNESTNSIQIYQSSTIRMQLAGPALFFYDSGGGVTGSLYADTPGMIVSGEDGDLILSTADATDAVAVAIDSSVVALFGQSEIGFDRDLDMSNNDIENVGVLEMNGDIDMNGNDITNLGSLSISSLTMSGDLSCDDIDADVIACDVLDLDGGGYIDLVDTIYFDSRSSNPGSPEGAMWFYNSGGTYEMRTYIGGNRYRFVLESV